MGLGLALAVGGIVVVTTAGDPGQARADLADKSFFVDITTVKANVDAPKAQDDASTGTFTVDCGVNENGHFNPDNFIAQPGVKNGAQHLHDYVGNLTTNADSNNQSLQAGGTTCKNGDKSAYFWPVIRIEDAEDVAENEDQEQQGDNADADNADADQNQGQQNNQQNNQQGQQQQNQQGQQNRNNNNNQDNADDQQADNQQQGRNRNNLIQGNLAQNQNRDNDQQGQRNNRNQNNNDQQGQNNGQQNNNQQDQQQNNNQDNNNADNNADNGNDNADQDNAVEEEPPADLEGVNDQNELAGNDGEIQRPASAELTFRGSPAGDVVAMPKFLRILYGDAKVSTNGTKNARDSWTCAGFEDEVLINKYPICPGGADVKRIHDFPSCWDGENIDSENHRDHIVFPNENGQCKDGFKAVPQLRITLTYDIPQDVQEEGRYKVDSFPEEEHNPFSDHDDFANVMPNQIMNRVVNCINTGKTCNE
jgi:hypothetical protein